MDERHGVEGVVLDLDGCVLEDSGHVAIHALAALRVALERFRARGGSVVLCSGRPASFMEAVALVLGHAGPLLFEWGSGLINDVYQGTPEYHPALTRHYFEARRAFVEFIQTETNPRYGSWIQPGKDVATTIFLREHGHMEAVAGEIHRYLEENDGLSQMTVHRKSRYIDVRPAQVDKAGGFRWLLSRGGRPPASRWLAIGDSLDDCSLFRECGLAGCPSNGDESARAHAHLISSESYLKGVLEVLGLCGITHA